MDMTTQATQAVGHVMSLEQLSILWHNDNNWAHILMDLPQRKCSAIPGDDPLNFPSMESGAFAALQNQIRQMWVKASRIFTCRKSNDLGWGLFVSEDYSVTERLLTAGNPTALGWVARAPKDDPTAHRYLRSPCMREKQGMTFYLGGPISLANYDAVDMVKCVLSISREPAHANTMLVTRSRKFTPGMEVLWTYNISARETGIKDFHPETEWKLGCCSESHRTLDRLSKRPCYQPHKTALQVKSFRPCTYCGKNLDEDTDTKGKRMNIKCHWALKHAAELASEVLRENTGDGLVLAKSFIRHLDLLSSVYNALHSMNYKIVPACDFFQITGTAELDPDSSQEEKEQVFKAFLGEGKRAFQMYSVLYMIGISKPSKYEDLLVPKNTNYTCVNWKSGRPSNTNFSMSKFTFTEEESKAHKVEIKSAIMDAAIMWME